MKIKRLSTCLLALMMCVGLFSTTAFASADEPEETQPLEIVETETAPVEETEAATEPVPMNPLTPDGNLTLVDDEGSQTGDGKQFVTVVTKTGNYFYLIIDRDDKGEQTVHFLNQVDEADLLKLMDEEEIEQLHPIVEEPVEETETEPEIEKVESEPTPEKKSNTLPAVIAITVSVGGLGFFAFKKIKDKQKEKEQAKPDPDADYTDDDFDYSDDDEDSKM